MKDKWQIFFAKKGCLAEAKEMEREALNGNHKESKPKVSRQSNVDAEVEIVEKYFSVPESDSCSYLMCQDIKQILSDIGEDVDIYKLGKALKILGFVKSTRRLESYDMRSVHCYAIDFSRMLKFKKAQKDGLEISGVKASDYDSPDEFNQAVFKSKNQ